MSKDSTTLTINVTGFPKGVIDIVPSTITLDLKNSDGYADSEDSKIEYFEHERTPTELHMLGWAKLLRDKKL